MQKTRLYLSYYGTPRAWPELIIVIWVYRMIRRASESKFFPLTMNFLINLSRCNLYYKFHFSISLRLAVLMIIIIAVIYCPPTCISHIAIVTLLSYYRYGRTIRMRSVAMISRTRIWQVAFFFYY